MATALIIKRSTRILSDKSEVFDVIIASKNDRDVDATEIVINCQDEKHQDRLVDELLIAGGRLA